MSPIVHPRGDVARPAVPYDLLQTRRRGAMYLDSCGKAHRGGARPGPVQCGKMLATAGGTDEPVDRLRREIDAG